MNADDSAAYMTSSALVLYYAAQYSLRRLLMTQPIWISHRGRCYGGAENTRAAFEYALAQGFNHFETDLRCTADGHIVLCHDPDLAAISDHPRAGEAIASLDLKTLKTIPLHDHQFIMTLAELLEDYAQYRWIFDIKPETAMQTLDIIVRHWWLGDLKWFFNHHVRFLFWQQAHLDYLRGQRNHCRIMADKRACWRAALAVLCGLPALGRLHRDTTYALPAKFAKVNLYYHKVVQNYHRYGAKVLAYLPETTQEIELARAAGVDEVLLDGIPLVVE